jgi:hypothetical protein
MKKKLRKKSKRSKLKLKKDKKEWMSKKNNEQCHFILFYFHLNTILFFLFIVKSKLMNNHKQI